MTNTDRQINALRPGQSIELSRSNGYRVIAERSGNGKTLRIVRESSRGFDVIREERF
jgi:hypothetical protein